MSRDKLFAHARYECCAAACGGAKHDRAEHESPPVAGRRFRPGLRNTVVLLFRNLSDRHLAQPQASRSQDSERSAGPPGQIKRDIGASISSLAVISFLFALGAWLHYQSGCGYKIHQMTIANTIVSFGFSMLVFDYLVLLVSPPAPYAMVLQAYPPLATSDSNAGGLVERQ